MLFKPFSTRSALTSRTVTWQPACAQTWAMPEPIRPQPATPTFSIGIPILPENAHGLIRAGRKRRSLSDLRRDFARGVFPRDVAGLEGSPESFRLLLRRLVRKPDPREQRECTHGEDGDRCAGTRNAGDL